MRKAPLLLAALALLTLSACKGGPSTSIEVTGPGEARILVSAVFDAEAADAVLADQSTLDDLTANVSRLTGSSALVSLGERHVEVSAPVSAERLPRMSDITGVTSVTASTEGEQTTVNVSLEQPTQLIESIRNATKERPDAKAVQDTMLRSGTVNVQVSFPGPLESSSGDGVSVSESGSTASVSRTLEQKGTASFTVTGGHQSPGRIPLYLAVGAVLAALGAGLYALRRRAS